MDCPRCHNPLPEGKETCERCASMPLASPNPPAKIDGRVKVHKQTGGISAGVNEVQNQYLGPVNQYYGVEPPSPPIPLKGRLSLNVPQRNPFFTGREEVLVRLHSLLQGADGHQRVPQALHGLGGVGKTQMACEYVHRYCQSYEGVFWVIGETPQQLASQLVALAPELSPPVTILPNQDETLRQVRGWFGAHNDWLLVVDNAENLPSLKSILPPLATGRLLLTTRDVDTGGLAEIVEVESLDEATGALLLLRRAQKLTHDQTLEEVDPAWQEGAKAVSRELDGLSLALNQAGAYIGTRRITPQQYLSFYRKRRQELHADYVNPDHPSVSVTFSLALERVRQIPKYGQAAMELAQLCAFLAPDAIPDEIFLTSPQVLPEVLAAHAQDEIDFADVCEAATRYALLRRTTDPNGLHMHRLAQEVLCDRLSETECVIMSERATRAINAAFPDPKFDEWPMCRRLLPHVMAIDKFISQFNLILPEAGDLLNKAGMFLSHLARYTEGELLYKRALAIFDKVFQAEHSDTAKCLSNLAVLYEIQGNYSEALHLYERALTILGKELGVYHLDTARCFHNVAHLLLIEEKYINALPLQKHALTIYIEKLGLKHPDTATGLNNLALIYVGLDQNDEALPLYERALSIRKKVLSPEHPDTAQTFSNLASLYESQGEYNKALSLYERALVIRENGLQAEHPDTAIILSNMAGLYNTLDNYDNALSLYKRALAIFEKVLVAEHPFIMKIKGKLYAVQAHVGQT